MGNGKPGKSVHVDVYVCKLLFADPEQDGYAKIMPETCINKAKQWPCCQRLGFSSTSANRTQTAKNPKHENKHTGIGTQSEKAP